VSFGEIDATYTYFQQRYGEKREENMTRRRGGEIVSGWMNDKEKPKIRRGRKAAETMRAVGVASAKLSRAAISHGKPPQGLPSHIWAQKA